VDSDACENGPSTSEPKTSDTAATSDMTTTTSPPKDQVKIQSVYKVPAQDRLKNEISAIQAQIAALVSRKNINALTSEEMKQKQKLVETLREKKASLKLKRLAQERQAKFRSEKKSKLEELCQKNPELKQELKIRNSRGRPCAEEDQPELLKAIVDIATYGSAADDRRRTESIRSVKTLDELTAALRSKGFAISRSGVYLHLLPRRSDTIEGKRHVHTVPVKLARAQTDSHKDHIDGKFAKATINNLEEIAAWLGPQEVCFLSQDDKARVPIGITAANKQAPLVMHVEYRVTLPDHDWVVASGHKLIPSVYAGIEIKPSLVGQPEAVSYSGPTYIAIRSAKHSSSTAMSHAADFCRLLQKPEFEAIIKDRLGNMKPIVMVTVDGGPDENPRYDKVVNVAIHHFLENDLDAYFVATNAPGRSAFNRVERRMAPLSRELAGLILPHEHYGSHLDKQGNTVNDELETANFAFAGKTLSEVWSGMVIDGFPVVAEYIGPDECECNSNDLRTVTIQWRNMHVRQSQYFTQIVKCLNHDCCRLPRSSYFNLIPDRFLPPPVPLIQTADGLRAPDIGCCEGRFPSVFLQRNLDQTLLPRTATAFKILPYDAFCPSQQTMLARRVCKKCGLYHASLASLKVHQQNCGIQAELEPRIRPIRVAARRQRELMAIIAFGENEDVEWLDDDLVDTSGTNLKMYLHNGCLN